MSEDELNPFERYDLDPAEGIAGITERMRDHIRAASTEADKAEIRAAWVTLTQDPRRRLALSLGAHPETRAPLGAPPPPPRKELALEAKDILPFVSFATCFGGSSMAPQTTTPWQEDLVFGAKPAASGPTNHAPDKKE